MSPAEAKKIANDRAIRLRRYVDLPDPAETNSPIYDVREVRDAMEHIDERWDRVTHGADPASVADWYVSAGLLLLAPTSGEQTQTPRGLRAFVPEAGTLFFGATSLDMFRLDLDMLALRNNIEDARAASLGPRQGRFTFSDLEVFEHLDEASRKAALVNWDRERETRLGALLAPPGGDRTG